MSIKIKLLQDYKEGEVNLIKDSILEVDEVTSKSLLENKIAELYNEKEEQEEIKEKVMSLEEKKEVKVEKSTIEIVKQEPKYKDMHSVVKALINKDIAEVTIKVPTGINETTAADGGNLVYHEMSNQIYGFAMQGAIIEPKCEKIPVGPNANGKRLPYLDNSGAISRTATPRGYWVAEGGQKTATKIAWGQHDLSLGKLIMYVPLTDEILEDRVGLESYVINQVKGKMAWMVDDAILNLATTTSGMIGVFDAGAANFRVSAGTHADPWTGTVVYDTISGVMPSLRGSSEWYMSNSTWQHVCGDLGGATTVSTVPVLDIYGMRLAGYKVNIMEQMAAFGGSANGSVLFGDFSSGYKIITKGEIKLDISKDIRFDYDETVLRLVLRVAGAPVIREQTLPDNTTVAAFSTTN